MQPVDLFTRSNSSAGEKEISSQHPSHPCSWPEPQLSEKMLMQALSVFSERRHALFKPASVWRGGVFPAASPFSLLSSIFIEWPVRLQQHARLTPRSANGQLPFSSTSRPHPPIPVPPKNEFSSLLRLFWRSSIKYGSPFTHFFKWKVTKVKWQGELDSVVNEEALWVTFNSGRRGVGRKHKQMMKEVEEEWSETAWLTPPTLLSSFPPPPIP